VADICPTGAFALKGALLGALWSAVAAAVLLRGETAAALAGWTLLLSAASAFFAMQFTGSSVITSLSGVRREMRVAVPLQAAAPLGALLAAGRFLGRGAAMGLLYLRGDDPAARSRVCVGGACLGVCRGGLRAGGRPRRRARARRLHRVRRLRAQLRRGGDHRARRGRLRLGDHQRAARPRRRLLLRPERSRRLGRTGEGVEGATAADPRGRADPAEQQASQSLK
jgi:hypothetical protein